MEKDKNTNPEGVTHLGIRILIIIGVLIILVALSIGIIKLVPRALSSLASVNVSISSIFSPKENITVSLDKTTVASGDAFILSWKSNTTKSGFYTLSFPCTDGVTVSDAAIKTVINCNSQLRLPTNASSTYLSIVSAKVPTVSVPLYVNFIDNATNKTDLTGSATITVQNAMIAPAPTGSATTTSSYSTSTSSPSYVTTGSNYSYGTGIAQGGLPDLQVEITAIGIADPQTGQFVATSNVNPNDRVIIKFAVSNVGTGASGAWNLQAQLPAYDPSERLQNLNSEPSLKPGQEVTGEIYFDRVELPGNNNVTITVDPQSLISEISKANNSATAYITSSGSYSGLPDLSVQILGTGIINPSNGQFVPTNSVRTGDTIAVEFQVSNLGGTETGPWIFKAFLPTGNQAVFTSNQNASLLPGAKNTYIASFTGASYAGNNTVTVQVDPGNYIQESNESNNSASTAIYVTN